MTNTYKQIRASAIYCLVALFTLNQATIAFGQQASKGSEDAQIQGWIQQLGDSRFTKRVVASKELQKIGLKAVPDLCQALDNSDPEVAQRAGSVLEQVLQKAATKNANSLPMGVLEQLATGRSSNLSAMALTILAQQKAKNNEKAKALLKKLSKNSDEKLAVMALDILDPMPTNPTARRYWQHRQRMKAQLESYKKQLAALNGKTDSQSQQQRALLQSRIRSAERSIQTYTRLINRYRNRSTPNIRGRVIQRGAAPAVRRIQIRVN